MTIEALTIQEGRIFIDAPFSRKFHCQGCDGMTPHSFKGIQYSKDRRPFLEYQCMICESDLTFPFYYKENDKQRGH